MNLFTEFKDLLFKKKVPDEKLLVPIMIWLSGSEKNIEQIQRVNKKFFRGNRNILISEVSLHNKCTHIIKYPKVTKDDEKTKFFYKDLCSYFDWTSIQLRKNINSINLDEMKEIISKAYGYNNKERKIIGLEAIKYGKQKTKYPKQSRLGEH